MTLILGLLPFWLGRKNENWLWLILPLGLVMDFWDQRPLGVSGLKILFIWLIFWLFLGRLIARKSKFKF